jgi:hypothetical protein
VYLTRFSTGQARKLLTILDEATLQIKKIVNNAKGIETKSKYRRISTEIERITKELSKQLYGQIELNFTALADEEIRFVEKTLNQVVKLDLELPAPAQVWAAASFGSYAGVDGKYTFQTYLNSLSDDLLRTWDINLRTGYLLGLPSKQIVRNVLGSVKDQDPGQIQKLRKSLEANTRTAISFMANEARNAVYKENDSLFDYYIRLETLDSRTCLACGVEDLKRYPDLESAPKLPIHHNCILGETCVSTIEGISTIFRRIYEGEIIVITTASGNILRCTPNHPILA